MGMAASQARLLTITARLADNELRSQTINNAKMRLATQSSQASDEYVSALNNANLMFSNKTSDGLSQTQALTFNSLTQYSPYNNQYGIVNSAGLLMVSEEDAKIFQNNSNNLNGFLEAHGLEWDTTFFNGTEGENGTDLAQKVLSFYQTGTDASGTPIYNDATLSSAITSTTTNKQLRDMYEQSISESESIEYKNYTVAAQKLYQYSVGLFDTVLPEINKTAFRQTDGTDVNKEEIAEKLSTNAALKSNESTYHSGTLPDGGYNNSYDNYGAYYLRHQLMGGTDVDVAATGAPTTGTGANEMTNFSFLQLKSLLPTGTITDEAYVKAYINSLIDFTDMSDSSTHAAYCVDPAGISIPEGSPTAGKPSYTITTGQTYTETRNQIVKAADGTTLTIGETDPIPDGYTFDSWDYIYEAKETVPDVGHKYNIDGVQICVDMLDTTTGTGDPSKVLSYGPGKSSYLILPADGYYGSTFYSAGSKIPLSENGELSKEQIQSIMEKIQYKDGTNVTLYKLVDDGTSSKRLMKYVADTTSSKKDVYDDYVNEYITMVTSSRWLIDPQAYAGSGTSASGTTNLEEYKKINDYFTSTYGEGVVTKTLGDNNDNYLIDLESFAKAVNLKSITPAETAFKESVVNNYIVNKMLDVLGEPKYAWVDKNDKTNTENADSKAQWYTNLFNRMQNGYKVLENGLAQSKEWMEYAFESGLVTMEQVDLSYNWNSLDYKSCSNITEETDNSSTVAKAEAKYQRAMNDIKAKDNIYDIQLKNIDTEHSSLQQEYESIQKALNKNIERTMKFCQNS